MAALAPAPSPAFFAPRPVGPELPMVCAHAFREGTVLAVLSPAGEASSSTISSTSPAEVALAVADVAQGGAIVVDPVDGGELPGLAELLEASHDLVAWRPPTPDEQAYASRVRARALSAYTDAVREAARAEHVVEQDNRTTREVTVYTDASKGSTSLAGMSMVADDGSVRTWTTDARTINDAELAAVAHAVAALAPRYATIHVRLDSLAAQRAWGQRADGVRPAIASAATSRLLTSLFRPGGQMRRTVVDVQRVPAHSGVALNEAADRLAVLARRREEAVRLSTSSPLAGLGAAEVDKLISEAIAPVLLGSAA